MWFNFNLKTEAFGRTEKNVAIGLFGILWLYLFFKAAVLPVLHDELATYFYYIQPNSYIPPFAHWDANNHILNSLFGSISYQIFGNSPLALRLPNVLSFFYLAYAAFHLAGRIRSATIRWGMLLALTTAPYLIEYIVECRGYGMSIGLFLMAGLHFGRLIELKQFKFAYLSLTFLFFATAANLTLIIPSLIIIVLIIYFWLFTQFKSKQKKTITQLFLFGIACLPFLYLIGFSLALKHRGALYYGGDTGLYDITISSLSYYFLGHYNLIVSLLITLLFAGILGYILHQIITVKLWLGKFTVTALFPSILIATILSILFLSNFMAVNFPEDRAGMYLFFLFILSTGFVLDELSSKNKWLQWIGLSFFYIPFTLLFHLNPAIPIFSAQERTSPTLFEIVADYEHDFKFPTTVGGYKTQEFCWYYLNGRKGSKEGKLHTNFHIGLDADFQLVRNGTISDSILYNYYQPIATDEKTALTLFERKKKLPKTLIHHQKSNTTDGFTTVDYFNLLKIDIDSLRNETLYIGAELTLEAMSKPFVAWITASISDHDGNALYQEYIALDWLKNEWDGSTANLLQGTLLHRIPEEAKTLTFYLWNIDETSYSIPDGKCYLYKLKRDYPNQH